MKKILAVLVITALPLLAADISFEENTVSAEGYSTIYVLPDAVIINFTVEVRDAKLGNIFKQANDLAGELSKELAKFGVDRPLITEGSGSIYSELDWESERLEHELSMGMRCIVEDLSKLDKIVKLMYELPSNSPDEKISFYDIMYTVKDPSAYLSQLQEKALAQAKIKAQDAAAAQGKTIGKLVNFADTPPWTGYMWGPEGAWEFEAEDMGGATSMPRISVGYNVMVTYELTSP